MLLSILFGRPNPRNAYLSSPLGVFGVKILTAIAINIEDFDPSIATASFIDEGRKS